MQENPGKIVLILCNLREPCLARDVTRPANRRFQAATRPHAQKRRGSGGGKKVNSANMGEANGAVRRVNQLTRRIHRNYQTQQKIWRVGGLSVPFVQIDNPDRVL